MWNCVVKWRNMAHLHNFIMFSLMLCTDNTVVVGDFKKHKAVENGYFTAYLSWIYYLFINFKINS